MSLNKETKQVQFNEISFFAMFEKKKKWQEKKTLLKQ